MTLAHILLHSEMNWVSLASLVGRFFIGICFVVHGLGKLGLVGTGNMQGFESWLESLHFPFPAMQARMAMLSEIIGGCLIFGGLFMRVGCLLCAAVMMVAASFGHKDGGYLITNSPPGNEYTINLAVVCILLFLIGPGDYSLDAYLFS